jgi:signal transduction histidine kinase
MKATLPRPELEDAGYSTQSLQTILQVVRAELSAQAACVVSLDYSPSADSVPACVPSLTLGQCAALVVTARAHAAHDFAPCLLTAEEIAPLGFASALLIPLETDGRLLGALVIMDSQPAAFTEADAGRIAHWSQVVWTVLENRVLHASQATARAIQSTATILGENPSAQQLVEVLRDYLFEPEISSCVVLSYGPLREDRPNGPFDYLEVQGTWTQKTGSGAGIGMRVYLDQYADLLTDLDTHGILEIHNVLAPGSPVGADPLVRAFLGAQKLQRAVLISFGGASRRLGVIVIGSDRQHIFSPNEIRAYRTVIEFMALHAMARVLQIQANFVQRGRAALLDAVKDGVLMILPSDGPHDLSEHSHVLTVNHSFCNLFDVSDTHVTGMPLEQLVEQLRLPEDVRRALAERWMSTPVRDPAVLSGEFDMIHPKGSQANIEWYSAPVYHENRVLGRIFTFHDVSAERAAVSLRANFVSRVSHELRTPLTSIKGFAQFMVEELNDQLPPLAREYAGIILSSARHLNNLFSEIIEITRADSGELNLTLSHIELPQIVNEVVMTFEPQAAERQQQIRVSVASDLPAIHVDAKRITGVIGQILKNAIYYSPIGTQIRISVQWALTPDNLPHGAPENLVLPAILTVIADEGPGLSVEEAVQVFTPFYRGIVAQANKIEGSGLGLTIARSIIELHGGAIWAEPRRRGRRGARFSFTLPPQ